MAVTLNGKGKSHAASLIAAGKINEGAWSFDASDSDALLGDPPDWSGYSTWFLGHDGAADAKTKGAWKYPFGKGGEVYLAALRAIASRASQQNETEIADAASSLLEDANKKVQGDLAEALAKHSAPKSSETRRWYALATSEDGESADLNVFDAIGGWFDGVTAKQFVADLQALPATVKALNVHVNSPGGEVFDAVAIANALNAHPAAKTIYIEGLAASAATIVTQGSGGKVLVADNAIVMIHNPFGAVLGTAAEMRAEAEALDRIQGAIIATYRRKSNLRPETLARLMDESTWMDADEAVSNGFADAKMKGKRAAASIDPRALNSLAIPERFRAAVEALAQPPVAVVEPLPAPEPPPAPEPEPVVAKVEPLPEPAPAPVAADPAKIISICAESGLDVGFAQSLLGSTEEDVKQLVAAAVDRRTAEESRAREIRALCKQYSFDGIGEVLVSAGTDVANARMIVSTLRSKLDAVEVDSTVRENGRREPAMSYAEAMDRMNNPAKYLAKQK